MAAYRSDLTQLTELLRPDASSAEEIVWDALTREALEQCSLALRERGYQEATMARKIAAVRSFFRFLVEEGTVSHNPAETLRARGPGRR